MPDSPSPEPQPSPARSEGGASALSATPVADGDLLLTDNEGSEEDGLVHPYATRAGGADLVNAELTADKQDAAMN